MRQSKGGKTLKLYNVVTVARFLDVSERRVRQLKAENVIQEYKEGTRNATRAF